MLENARDDPWKVAVTSGGGPVLGLGGWGHLHEARAAFAYLREPLAFRDGLSSGFWL